MRDVLAKMRECGKDVKMRDFPHDCGMVDTYANSVYDKNSMMDNVDEILLCNDDRSRCGKMYKTTHIR